MRNYILLFCFTMLAGMAMGQLKIESSGFAKVGDTGVSAATNLHVAGAGSTAGIRFDRTDFAATGLLHTAAGNPQFRFTRSGVDFSFGNRAGRFHIQPESNISSSGAGLTIIGSGNVGIGVLVPAHDLDVSGTTRNTSGSWISGSDKKLKKNIQKYQAGLDEVLAINPVTFQYNGKGGMKSNGQTIVGVIAQDFQKIAPYAVSTFDHLEFATTKSGDIETEEVSSTESYLQVDNGPIKYMLINAIKEQQELIESLQDQISELTELVALTVGDNENNTLVELSDNVLNELNQNQPNPYNDQTTIDYIVSSTSKSAKMKFYNMNGQLIKTVVLQNGKGKVTVSSDELPAGTYTYSLEVDGQLVSNKKMVKMR